LANKIIVLDEGEIIEEGTHETLIAQRGVYFDLYEKQTQADEVEAED
jgi:ATP-binding cassette subfamily B protein